MNSLDSYDYRGAFRQRQLEAKSLYDNSHFHCSIYLLGYALECVLKAYIRNVKNQDPPWEHNIELLREKAKISKTELFGSSLELHNYLEVMIHDKNWVNMRYRVNDFENCNENEINGIFEKICDMIKKVRRKMT